MTQPIADAISPRLPNGAGAATCLSAGIGAATLGVLSALTDKSPAIKAALIVYKPTGALSGVTTLSVLAWIIAWAVLHMLWSKKEVAVHKVVAITCVLVALCLLLTCPPVVDAL
ncbi:MAG: hypothetical protein V4734_11460 [Terriglobus sp.]